MPISRREFFAVAGTLAASAAPLGIPIGSQTYPHRQRIKDGDFAELCKDFAALGVKNIELCSPGYAEFASLSDAKQTRKIIEDHGLKCPSAHFTMNELRNKQPEMIEWAKEIGMTQMGVASLGGRAPATMDDVKTAAEHYNDMAEGAWESGLQQFLHDENFEMAKVDGRLVYEVLLEVLDPHLVKMQFQMSAMRAVGDPVMYFKKYPGRFISMHLQGVDLNAAPGARTPGVAVGKDSLDWKKIFAAAPTGGVKNYFVEQNWDLTVESVAFLKTLE